MKEVEVLHKIQDQLRLQDNQLLICELIHNNIRFNSFH